MQIAIVGTGIAGNVAAWTLSRRHAVTVYEKEQRLGGHSHTVTFEYDGRRIAVDTGFIVYNELNYPGLTALFAHLGVATTQSSMSFSLSADHGAFEWKGGGNNFMQALGGLFAQPANLLSASYLRMLRDMTRFNQLAVQDLRGGTLAGLTLGDYCRTRQLSERLMRDYLLPMGAAIWSTSADEMLNFPAENFITFFDNHRLLHYGRPQWRTVTGGSREYVERLTSQFRDRVRIGCEVSSIRRTNNGVIVTDTAGVSEQYDQVVLAAHSDQSLSLLSDASNDERSVLGAIRYAPNVVYLHRDLRLMPRRRRAWAAWNFLRWPRQSSSVNDIAVTYWMNELQDIERSCPLFVSLNPPFAPEPHLTFGRYDYEHPQYDLAAFAAQKRIADIQGRRHTWFCGAWQGYGFHEDGLQSALGVAQALGGEIPWNASPSAMMQAAE